MSNSLKTRKRQTDSAPLAASRDRNCEGFALTNRTLTWKAAALRVTWPPACPQNWRETYDRLSVEEVVC